jgi:hypothetical protein
MSLKVNYEKVSSKAEAYTAVKRHITPELIEKFKVTAKVDYQESKNKIVAVGKGFELNISLLDDCAEATIKLSLILRPLKGKILDGIEKQLKRVV